MVCSALAICTDSFEPFPLAYLPGSLCFFERTPMATVNNEEKDTLLKTFTRLSSDLEIDAKLLKRVHLYERAFCNRNSDHAQFFGGNLMGVNQISFRPTDRDAWFTDVIQMDELDLKDAIASIEDIKKDWARANDAMNHSCIWLLHAIFHSKHLTVWQKHEGMIDVLLVLQYKFITSLMNHYYPYVADRSTMEAAYASLNRRFSLKQAGSWSVLLRQRAADVITPNSIWRPVIDKFTPDMQVVNMFSDIQGRLRKIVRAMTEVFHEVRTKGGRMGRNKPVLTIDGETVRKDKPRQYTSYIRELHRVLDDPRSFIRDELVDLVCDIQHTLPRSQLKLALEWMSFNHREEITQWKPKTKPGQG